MPALAAIAGKGAVRIENEPARVHLKGGHPHFMEGYGQLLGITLEQRLRDPLLKSFPLQRPLLINLVFAAKRPETFQTLEVTLLRR